MMAHNPIILHTTREKFKTNFYNLPQSSFHQEPSLPNNHNRLAFFLALLGNTIQ
jgi:hypothetical protein